MEAKDYFFRLSYQQYKQKKEEEREKWEPEVLRSIMEKTKEYVDIDTPFFETFMRSIDEIELIHSNSFEIEKLVSDILKREENEHVALILNYCWVAQWDLPDTKNACVEMEPFYDESHLVRINSEFTVNLSRIAWLYTTILLFEDLTPYSDFRDRVSLNILKNKFIKDMKNDTDEGTSYLTECFLTLDTKNILNKFVTVFYESALVFILMHEVGHILESDESICKYFGLNSSKAYKGLSYDERQRKAEENSDRIGYKYSDEYIGIESFFNMGPVLAIFTLAINHKNIRQETDHPSLKSRYENALSVLFKEKNTAEVLHTRKLLYIIGEVLQNENCWSVEDKDWWKNGISL